MKTLYQLAQKEVWKASAWRALLRVAVEGSHCLVTLPSSKSGFLPFSQRASSQTERITWGRFLWTKLGSGHVTSLLILLVRTQPCGHPEPQRRWEKCTHVLRKKRIKHYQRALAPSSTVCCSGHQTAGWLFFQHTDHTYFFPKIHDKKSHPVTEIHSKPRMSEFILSV